MGRHCRTQALLKCQGKGQCGFFSKRFLFSLSSSPNISFTAHKSQNLSAKACISGQHQHTYLKDNVNRAFIELSLCKCRNITSMSHRPRKFWGSTATSLPFIAMRLCGAATADWGSWNAAMRDCMVLTGACCFQGRGDKKHHISPYSYRKTELKLLWCPNSQRACNFQKGKGLTGSGFTECPVLKVLIRTGFVRENNNLRRQVVCRKRLGSSWFCFSWSPGHHILPSLCLLCQEQVLGNGDVQHTGSFYPTADQETQNPFIQCTYTKQTNWRHRRCVSLLQFLNM